MASQHHSGVDPRLSARLRQHLKDKYLDPGHLVGCQTLVAYRGELVLCDTLGLADRDSGAPLEEDAIFRIYSMTKPLTSIALMQQYELGRFLLEDPVGKHLPELAELAVWKGGDWPNYQTEPPARPPTIRDLLTHTSGLTYDFMRRTNVDYGYRKDDLIPWKKDRTLKEFVGRLAAHPLEFSPGTRWNYSVATDVCGRLVEVLSGQPFDQYLDEHILKPLGMKDTGFQVPQGQEHRLVACYQHIPGGAPQLTDPAGPESTFCQPAAFLSGGGGLVSTAADYYRFCSMLLSGGSLDGQRIIGPRTLELMTRNHLPGGADMASIGTPSTFSEAPFQGVGFGLGFAVLLDPDQASGKPGELFWGGLASTAFWVSPADELTVIFMTQLIPSSTWPVRRELRAIINGCLLD